MTLGSQLVVSIVSSSPSMYTSLSWSIRITAGSRKNVDARRHRGAQCRGDAASCDGRLYRRFPADDADRAGDAPRAAAAARGQPPIDLGSRRLKVPPSSPCEL